MSLAGVLAASGLPAAAPAAHAAPVRAGAAVVGGHPVSSGWPGTAALLNSWMPPGHDYSRAFCSGTLIAPAVVLTAAHCVNDKGAGDIQIVAGADDLTMATERDAIAVTAIRVNPSGADLAVLELERPADAPVTPLARPGDWARDAIAAGWGDTSAGSGAGSPYLVATSLRLQSDRTCRSWWDDSFEAQSMLCAGQAVGHDVCEGDSGGPLMVSGGSGWRLLGVTLFGDMECGANGTPGVYAWVAGASLRDWVLAQGATSPAAPLTTTTPTTKSGRKRSRSARRA